MFLRFFLRQTEKKYTSFRQKLSIMLNVIAQRSGALKNTFFFRVSESKGAPLPDSCLGEGNGQRGNKNFAVEEPGVSENSSRYHRGSADSGVSPPAPKPRALGMLSDLISQN